MDTKRYSLFVIIIFSVGALIFFLRCIPDFLDETPPEVLYSIPDNGEGDYPPALSIGIMFNDRMDTWITEDAFSITPYLEGDFEWFEDDKLMKFYPYDYLEEDTDYSVKIDTTAQDSAGNAMLESYEMSFSTAQPISNVSGGCDTAEIGSYYVAVFNRDDYGWPEETCDFRSAVYPYSRDESEDRTPDPTRQYTNRLLDLRTSTYIGNQETDTKTDDTRQPFRSTNPDDYAIGQTYYIGGDDFVLKFKREHCFVWMKEDDDHGNNGDGGDLEDYDDDGDGVSLENYADYFNDHSWDAIIDNFTGDTNGWSWGSYPPEVVHILFEDMGTSPAGYYNPWDIPLNAIHINTIPAQNGTDNNYGEPNPVFTNGTLTHEFQHLAHDQVGSPFSIWLNEMCSSTAESVWSGQTGIYINFFNEHNDQFHEVSLVEWSSPDHRHRYAIAALFGTWLSFQSKQGSDNGVFFRTLYQNKDFDSDDMVVVIKTAKDVCIYNGSVNYGDSTSVNNAWRDIYADFVAALMFNEDYGSWGFNGAWNDSVVNATHPWTGQPIQPEVYYYTPGKVDINTSGFAFFKVHKRIIETDNIIVYDPYEVRE
jgi:hypothetical protein